MLRGSHLGVLITVSPWNLSKLLVSLRAAVSFPRRCRCPTSSLLLCRHGETSALERASAGIDFLPSTLRASRPISSHGGPLAFEPTVGFSAGTDFLSSTLRISPPHLHCHSESLASKRTSLGIGSDAGNIPPHLHRHSESLASERTSVGIDSDVGDIRPHFYHHSGSLASGRASTPTPGISHLISIVTVSPWNLSGLLVSLWAPISSWRTSFSSSDPSQRWDFGGVPKEVGS